MSRQALTQSHITLDTQTRAMRSIFRKCLNLHRQGQVLILIDEQFDPYLAATERAIEKEGLYASIIRVSLEQQNRIVREHARSGDSNISLPSILTAAIVDAPNVLNILAGEESTTSFRRAVIQARRSSCSLGHIPGMSDEILNVISKTPIEEIERTCDALGWALGEAREARIETVDRHGQTHILSLVMDGWENEPIISPGIIRTNSWGNIPPGEVFCCPEHSHVEGSICINGSIPRRAFGPGEEVVLHFHGGKMSWDTPSDRSLVQFFVRERNRARRLNDEHWNTFAELGIGLNPAIRQLTGNALLDEKAAHTLHIAFGDNSGFGHAVEAKTHADLIVREPTLSLDGLDVIRKGRLLLEELEQRRVHQRIDNHPFQAHQILAVMENHGIIENEGDGPVLRRLSTGGRVGYVRVASDRYARTLGRAWRELKTYRRPTFEKFVGIHPSYDGIDTVQLLTVLLHYGMIEIRGSETLEEF